jgi:membrane peptidoglycan carboxypeptidase
VADLTPRETAFLVCLLPGPIKYQKSIASGVPTPFFEGLVDTLLATLHSVGALSDEAYEAALGQTLDLRPLVDPGRAEGAADPAG